MCGPRLTYSAAPNALGRKFGIYATRGRRILTVGKGVVRMSMTEESYRQSLGAALVRARRGMGKSQEEVARAIGVPLGVYGGWERGKKAPRGVAWLQLCEYFNWPHPLRSNLEVTEPNLCLPQLASDLPFSGVAPQAEPARSLAEVA